MSSKLKWSLLTDHIAFDDMRGQDVETLHAASYFQIPGGAVAAELGLGYAVNFDRNDAEVSKAKAKAKFWLMPDGVCRPLPLGNALSKAEMKRILGCSGSLECSDWEGACGTHEDVDGVFVRYHYDGEAPPRDGQNLNTMLMSSTLFDVPAIMEFRM